MCRRVAFERQKSGYKLTFDFFFSSFLSPNPEGSEQKCRADNNGRLSLPGKRQAKLGGWGMKKEGVLEGVYLSHGNWFAGVEVGSFKKTSFSLTPSHLSVWKAAGRKSGSTERGRQ